MQHALFLPYSVMIKKVMTVAIFAMVLSGCTTRPAETETRDGYFACHVFKAKCQNERVRFLVMHYTALDDNKSLKTLTEDPVSAHYLVPQKLELKRGKPVVLQLVDENKRACHRRGAFRQSVHSPETPLIVATAAGNTHPPSPTVVSDSDPHPDDRIFHTGDTTVCALHTSRSARGQQPRPCDTPLDGARRCGACTIASHFMQVCFSRTVWITRKALRISSSCSAVSSPW